MIDAMLLRKAVEENNVKGTPFIKIDELLIGRIKDLINSDAYQNPIFSDCGKLNIILTEDIYNLTINNIRIDSQVIENGKRLSMGVTLFLNSKPKKNKRFIWNFLETKKPIDEKVIWFINDINKYYIDYLKEEINKEIKELKIQEKFLNDCLNFSSKSCSK